ncbi:MAG: hypothetical protein HY671_03165 [Chloroflexi bacterium]|nr:hypothetical protein [Chloroflexota bacterium]
MEMKRDAMAITKAELIKRIDAEDNLAQGCVMFAYIVSAVPWRETIKTFVGPCRIHIGSGRLETVLEFAPDQILKRYEAPIAIGDDGHNIVRLGMNNAIRQAFESTKSYCDDLASGQIPRLPMVPFRSARAKLLQPWLPP